jgi:hypothetical protein
MRRIATFLAILAAASASVLFSAPANAQASRTWVSGVGDDANPCSRTAPCKTFAGAISKTAANGIINCVDPGGFGAVTITKSITIDCEGTQGGILASLTNGVNVNGAGIVVHLRNLSIEGFGNGLIGVNFINGSALYIENCEIFGFQAGTATGVKFSPSVAGGELYITDAYISSNGTGVTGAGIQIQPVGVGSAKVVLTRVEANNNVVGIRADHVASTGGINVTVADSESSGNAFHGIVALSTGVSVQIMVDNTTSANNADQGIRAAGNAAAVIRLANSNVTGTALGTSASGGAQILSYGNNHIDGNTNDGAALPVIPET